jgi:prepilin-type N-terminal cleavage/methylation domain-containing protein
MARKGFTLIELMIVLVTVGLLAVALFPTFAAARERRNVSTCADTLRQIYRALQLYQADWDGQLPPHNPTAPGTQYDDNPKLMRSTQRGPDQTWPPRVEWQQYGLSYKIYHCPTSRYQRWPNTDYQFRLAFDLEFDDRWSNSARRATLHGHPEWTVPGQVVSESEAPDMLQRTIVPEPESVLVVCDAHLRYGNAWPAEWVTGSYQLLRASGKVECVPAASAKYWGYKNGKWYPNDSQMPMATEIILTFPREPWPPRFKTRGAVIVGE